MPLLPLCALILERGCGRVAIVVRCVAPASRLSARSLKIGSFTHLALDIRGRHSTMVREK